MHNIKYLLLCTLMCTMLTGCSTNSLKTENINYNNQKEYVMEEFADIHEEYPEELVDEIAEEIIVEEVGIRVDDSRVQKEYHLNENLILNGLQVYIQYSDGTEKEVPVESLEYSEIDTSKYGVQTITIKFKEYVYEFDVEVVYTVNEVDPKTKYSSTSLNLRNGPGTNFDKIKTISLNDEVTVIGEIENGWVKVKFKDDEYFCSGKYLMDKKKEIQVQPASPYDNKIYGEPGSSADIVNKANAYWNKNVPNWLKQKFIDSGWRIAISGTSLAARYGYGMSIAGITDYGSKIVFIDNREKPIKNAMIHELGHFVDYVYGFPSQSGEFTQIFNEEKHSFIDCTSVGDGHETSNVMEYFAAVFQNAIINGGNCKTQAPRSYEFVCRYMH